MSNITKEELDLEKFVELFDTAMNSDNPAVQKCFNNLMLVVALVHAEDKEKHDGPLKSLVNEFRDMQKRLSYIEHTLNKQTKVHEYNDYVNINTHPYWSNTTNGHGYVPPFSGATSTYTLKKL